MVSVRLEHLADKFTFECCPEFACFVKLVSEPGRRTKQIAVLPVAPTAQPCGVVSRQHSPTARTATTGRRPHTSPGTGGAHLILAEVGADLARTRVPEAPGSHQRVTRPGRSELPPVDIPGENTACRT